MLELRVDSENITSDRTRCTIKGYITVRFL